MTTLVIVLLVLAAMAALLWRTLLGFDPPMPSTPALRAAAARAIARHANTEPPLVIVDLGSGFGGLARRLALAFPDSTVMGIEIALLPHLWAAAVTRLAGPTNLRFVRQYVEAARLESGFVYVCYLSRKSMTALRVRFEHEVPRGGLLVSCAFSMPGWTPTCILKANDVLGTPVYVYRY